MRDRWVGQVLEHVWSGGARETFLVVAIEPRDVERRLWICVGWHDSDGHFVRTYDVDSLTGCKRVA